MTWLNLLILMEIKKNITKQFDAITTTWQWNKQLSENERTDYINSLINKGLSEHEAEMYVNGESKIGDYVMNNKDSAYIIQ